MATTQDFRTQTTNPAAPGAGVVTVFADASGRLISRESGGRTFMAGAFFTGTKANANVATGGQSQMTTGVVFGVDGGTVVTGLGQPHTWFIVRGSDNLEYCLPAYRSR